MGLIRNALNRKRAARGEPTVEAKVRKRVEVGLEDVRIFHEIWKPRCVGWWAGRLLRAAGVSWEQCLQRKLYRLMRVDSACTGLGSCITGIAGLGLPVDRVNCCEADEEVTSLLLKNHGQHIGCMYRNMRDHAGQCGPCATHGGGCRSASRKRRDLLILGPPCQPFCRYATTKGPDHPLFQVVFGWRYGSHESGICGDNVLDFVDKLQPRAVLLEEVATLFGGGAIHDGKDACWRVAHRTHHIFERQEHWRCLVHSVSLFFSVSPELHRDESQSVVVAVVPFPPFICLAHFMMLLLLLPPRLLPSQPLLLMLPPTPHPLQQLSTTHFMMLLLLLSQRTAIVIEQHIRFISIKNQLTVVVAAAVVLNV